MINSVLSQGLDNVVAEEVNDEVVKEETKSSSLRFKSMTDATIRKKYEDWRRQNQSTKQVKDEIKEAVKTATNTSDEDFKEKVIEHVSLLMSKYKFLKVDIQDSAQLIGNRAIKLNDMMSKNVRENCHTIFEEIDNEMIGAKKTKAEPLPEEDQEDFMKEVENAAVEENVPVEENAPAEENAPVEETTPEVEEKPEERKVDGEYSFKKEEIGQDVPYKDIESEQVFNAQGMTEDEIKERQIELGNAEPEEKVIYDNKPAEVEEAAKDEPIEDPEEKVIYDAKPEEKEETPAEEEVKDEEPIEEEKPSDDTVEEDKVTSEPEVVNMDIDEFNSKKANLEESIKKAIDRRNAAKEKSASLDSSIEEARAKLEEKKKEILAKVEEVAKNTMEEAEKQEEDNARKEEKLNAISEENEQLDSDISSLMEMLGEKAENINPGKKIN